MFVWIFGWKILVINRRTDIFVLLFFCVLFCNTTYYIYGFEKKY